MNEILVKDYYEINVRDISGKVHSFSLTADIAKALYKSLGNHFCDVIITTPFDNNNPYMIKPPFKITPTP